MGLADDWDAKVAEAEALRPPNHPTELTLPAVEFGMKRGWPADKRPADGSWVAVLEAPPFELWSCGHSHPTEAGALSCAGTALALVKRGEDPGNFRWPAEDVDRPVL